MQIILLLLIKRYNLFKVLACSTTFFHLSLFCATFFQLRTFMLFQNVIFPTYFRSSNWSFIHGFPSLDLLHIVIFGHAFNMAQNNYHINFEEQWIRWYEEYVKIYQPVDRNTLVP